jgi:hypothetical protein
MLKHRQMLIGVAYIVIGCTVSLGQSASQLHVTKPVDQYIPAIIQAVEDEIYDYKYENNYFLIDNQGAGDSTPAKIGIYISTELSQDGDGVAVYKLMPYGDVYRRFVIQKNGLVTLLGNPQKRFPPIGGSVLTVYMSDDDVCDFIQHRSIKSYFIVDPNVSKERVEEAIQRQLKRVGFSDRQYSAQHPKRK